MRITAQLIDAETGGHLWADRFDRELSDIFAVQDEVTRRIVDALIKLSPGESARLSDVETTNAKAHDFFLAGREALWGTTRNRETFERSTDLLEKAIGEDPSYGEPYAGLAFAQILNWQFHWTDDWSESLDKAERHLDLALQKSPQIAFVHYIAAVFYLALVQIAGAGKRPVLYCRDFKLGARHSTLQAQVDLGHPDVPVRIVPCGCDASIRYRRS